MMSKQPVLLYFLLMSMFTALPAKLPQIKLHLPEGSDMVEGMPFVQAVPIPQGRLNVDAAERLFIVSDGIKGEGEPVTLWPDGSVQWLLVRGVLTSGFKAKSPSLSVSLQRSGPLINNNRSSSVRAQWKGAAVRVDNTSAGTALTMTLSASIIAVSEQVRPESKEPDYLDETGQYLWAAPKEIVSAGAAALPLTFVLKEESYRQSLQHGEYLFRGEAYHPEVSGWLEWQLRLSVADSTEVMHAEMTWSAFWDEQKWALAGASLKLETKEVWTHAKAGEATTTLDSSYSLANQPNGVGKINGEQVTEALPNSVVLQAKGGRLLGLALPDFNKLGPNRIELDQDHCTIHFWDSQSGQVLDLRRTGEEDEFNIASADLRSRPLGLSRTLDIWWVPGVDMEQVEVLSSALAERQNQWLPRAEELLATGVLGPVLPQVLENNQEYLLGLQANLHFLLASQQRWRWYGFINYGDVQTNFAFGRNADRGLYPLRWALSGRYGWRNVSGDVPYSVLFAGLLLEDREIVLMGLNYVRHVVDVDFSHPPISRRANAEAGGFHRRNRDHWSGSVQMQYSPSNGVYLGSWLSGSRRAKQTLQSLREYSLQMGKGGSALGAQAWINFYREGHSSEALAIAEDLLAHNGDWWAARPGAKGAGIEALYANNFRWLSDGVKTLMAFYNATGQDRYLELIESLLFRELNGAHGLGSMSLQAEAVLGYLIGSGVKPERLTELQYERIRDYIRQQSPTILPEKELWNYDVLVEMVTETLPGAPASGLRESNAIGRRAHNAWFALNLLETESSPAETEPTRSGGTTGP